MLAGIMGAICYITGSIVAIMHSIVELKKMFKKIKVFKRIKDRQFQELILDNNTDDLIGAVVIFLMFIMPIFVSYVLMYEFYNKAGFNWILFIYYICLFALGIRWTKIWWHYISEDKNEYNYSQVPYGEFRSIVEEMCINAGIYNLEFYFLEVNKIGALAFQGSKKRRRGILFYQPCETLPSDELAALVAYEIAHFKNGDFNKIEKFRRLIGLVLVLVGFYVSMLLLYFLSNIYILDNLIVIIISPIVLVYGIAMVIFFSIDDRRLWKQIQEIRADRIACTYEGVTHEAMINLLTRLKKQGNEKMPWYKALYSKYFKVKEHPCLDRRIYLIKNYKKWLIFDYYVHAWQMFKWFVTGKGWIGE
ncbi:MAG: M48 family metalloprotease [Tissierellaceae bacterium]